MPACCGTPLVRRRTLASPCGCAGSGLSAESVDRALPQIQATAERYLQEWADSRSVVKVR